MKAIAKYPGSKWSLADWIIRFFPEHHSYVEPFFGTGAVLFNKPRSHIETINDLDGNVVNLFECIRSDPERLARSIYMTPYARDVDCMEDGADYLEEHQCEPCEDCVKKSCSDFCTKYDEWFWNKRR